MLEYLPPYRSLHLDLLMEQSAGDPALSVGIIDGAIDLDHSGLQKANIQFPGRSVARGCQSLGSEACRHGTFIIGILAAGRESATPGICPGCSFLALPIFCESPTVEECPPVTSADLAEQLLVMIGAGARIINLSLGSTSLDTKVSSRLMEAYSLAKDREVLIIAASGNQGAAILNPTIRHPWVISVAATAINGKLYHESNFPDATTLLAPGVNVKGLKSGGGFCFLTGTSVAAPFVTGAAALIWSLVPEAAASELRAALLSSHDHRTNLFDASIALRDLRKLKYRSSTKTMTSLQFSKRSRSDALALQSSISAGEANRLDKAESEQDLVPSEENSASTLAPQGNGSSGTNAVKEPSREQTTPQACSCSSSVPASFVYSIGTVRPAFPNEGLRKEYEFAASQLKVQPTDYYTVLSNPSYYYIAQEACWILEISDIDAFILHPRSGTELQDLIQAIKPIQNSVEKPLSILIGSMFLDKPYPRCPEIRLPVVVVNQVFYFDFQTLIKSLTAKNIEVESVKSVLEALKLKPNPGISDSDRALNYVAFRFPEMYKKADELKGSNQQPGYFIVNIKTRPSEVQGNRQVVDVIFKYQQYDTEEQQFYYCGIDVTGQFPFLQTPLRLFVPAA